MAITKRDWLETGLSLVSDIGANILTIEVLTGRLGVTKGSFYHHFQNWQAYKEQLLSFYEQEKTLQVIENAEARESPRERLKLIAQISVEQTNALEVAMRAWALLDPFVRVYQARIDNRRLTYLEEQILLICHHHERSKSLARLFYSVFIGSQHLLPPVQGQDLLALYRELSIVADFWFIEQ